MDGICIRDSTCEVHMSNILKQGQTDPECQPHVPLFLGLNRTIYGLVRLTYVSSKSVSKDSLRLN